MLSELNIVFCVILKVPFVELQEFFVLQKLIFLPVSHLFIAELKELHFRFLKSMQDFFRPNTEPNVKI